ncbi:chymotrypsin inhibitor-like [Arctopsyche grandis]|uniref:chymotrypsin inhibitor-like n=1 Tax=Arctopsyche grandis TaxID=121162 RepID=UPI00406D9F7D
MVHSNMKLWICACFLLLAAAVDIKAGDDSDECDDNEEYTKCGVKCQPTCDNPHALNSTCTRECLVGCICKKNYIRNSDGDCVKPEHCNRNS